VTVAGWHKHPALRVAGGETTGNSGSRRGGNTADLPGHRVAASESLTFAVDSPIAAIVSPRKCFSRLASASRDPTTAGNALHVARYGTIASSRSARSISLPASRQLGVSLIGHGILIKIMQQG